jgi:uncharacterized protein
MRFSGNLSAVHANGATVFVSEADSRCQVFAAMSLQQRENVMPNPRLNSATAFCCVSAIVTVLTVGMPAVAADDVKASAQNFVECVSKGDFAKATKDFDKPMQKALPVDRLEATWKLLVAQVGPFKRQAGVRVQHTKKYEVVYVVCEFEKLSLNAKLVFNSSKQITGLFFTPIEKTVDYQVPEYVRRDAFRESEVKIGTGQWQLPGTLTVPVVNGPFPAVVLVHGSGAHDRDETIGPNKPFRDLAWGLATNGVAVLRYEKRNKAYPNEVNAALKTFTIKDEVTDDAIAAVACLRHTDKIDPQRIFVLGHSLGGQCTPRIGSLDHRIAGLISLAGNTRPPEEVLLDQLDYVRSLGGDGPEQNQQIDSLRKQVAELKGLAMNADTPASKLLPGTSAAYWASLRECKAPEIARGLKQPILILQGERDYQVTMADFQGWKQALSGRSNATLKSYPALNHLFMEGRGKATPSEYEKVGHVSKEVINDVADWIKMLGKQPPGSGK